MKMSRKIVILKFKYHVREIRIELSQLSGIVKAFCSSFGVFKSTRIGV